MGHPTSVSLTYNAASEMEVDTLFLVGTVVELRESYECQDDQRLRRFYPKRHEVVVGYNKEFYELKNPVRELRVRFLTERDTVDTMVLPVRDVRDAVYKHLSALTIDLEGTITQPLFLRQVSSEEFITTYQVYARLDPSHWPNECIISE